VTFFTGNRLAARCEFVDHNGRHVQKVLVFDLRTRVAVQLMAETSITGGRLPPFGTILDGPVLSGGQVEFESSEWKGFPKTTLRRQRLWAADGEHRRLLRSAPRLGALVAGDDRWLVFTHGSDLEITSPNGRSARLLHLPKARSPQFVLAGDELVRLAGGRLESWNVRSGRVLNQRTVPAAAQLQAVDSQYIVYTAGPDIHLLSSTGDDVIHAPENSSHVSAALTSAGLFYAYNVKDGRYPGRVVFVPRSELPR
jgi:hypothetical protein